MHKDTEAQLTIAKPAFPSEETISFSPLDYYKSQAIRLPNEEHSRDFCPTQYLIVAAVISLIAIPYLATEIGVLCALFHAHLGDVHSQHMVAQHYLQGVGVKQSDHQAFKWFRRASDNGDHRAGYNLALAHVHRTHETLEPGEAEVLIKRAADAGMQEAIYALEYTCAGKKCRR